MKSKTKKKLSGNELRKQRKKRVSNGKKEIKKSKDKPKFWVPGGSVMYNLACSDNIHGAYKPGTMANVVGDSSAGKSFLVLSGLAECANNPKFDDYLLVYDDAEYANSFDMEYLFGSKLVERMIGPDLDDPSNFSTTIEQFGDFIFTLIENKQPFIYIMDSFDAIDSEDEVKKEKANREKRKKGQETKGSFQAAKQKKASQMFRQICGGLSKLESNLIVVSQTRDNLSAVGFATKYRAGGKALKFYSSIESWLTYIKPLTKEIKGKKYRQGVMTRLKMGKNKFSGKYRDVDFPIFYDYGIDDLSACIDYLVRNNVYKKKGQTIISDSLEIKATKQKLINYIEKKKKKKVVFKDTQNCWNDIENSLRLDRISKFG